MLLERAGKLLADRPGVLNLGIEPTPPLAPLTAPAREPALFHTPQTAPDQSREGPGRVVSTDSRVLYEALAAVFTDLGFDTMGTRVFRDLGFARVVEPTSLLETGGS